MHHRDPSLPAAAAGTPNPQLSMLSHSTSTNYHIHYSKLGFNEFEQLLIYGGPELFPASAMLNSGSDALVSKPPDIEETIYGYYHKRIKAHQSVEGHRAASKSCITYLKG